MDLICKDAYVYIYIYNYEHVHASPSNLSLKPVGVVGRPHPRVPFWGHMTHDLQEMYHDL